MPQLGTLIGYTPEYIGVSESTVSSPDPVTVAPIGTITSSLTGLTPGNRYYVRQSDGFISETQSDLQAGIALADDKLLITKQ